MAKATLKSKAKSKQLANAQAPTLTKKELAAQKRHAANVRKEFFSAIAQSLLVAIPIAIIGFAVTEKPEGGLGGLLATSVLLLSARYPRQAIWAFLIYMPFSGTVTYWLASGNAIFQLAKDAFYIPAVIGLYQYCQRHRLPFLLPKQLVPFFYLLLSYCILVILVVNTSTGDPGE